MSPNLRQTDFGLKIIYVLVWFFAIFIDHFKKFNDSFGHDAGDVVLKELAGLMQRVFREEDVVCRYGGGEVLIALLDVDEAQGMGRGGHPPPARKARITT